MTRQDDHRAACATLTYLAEPADPVLGRLLQVLSPAEVLASIRPAPSPPAQSEPFCSSRARAGRTIALKRLPSPCERPGHTAHAEVSVAIKLLGPGGRRLSFTALRGSSSEWPGAGITRPAARNMLWQSASPREHVAGRTRSRLPRRPGHRHRREAGRRPRSAACAPVAAKCGPN